MAMIKVSQILTAYIKEEPGHKNSQGEVAPFVIKSHDTGKDLASFKTRTEAKEHLRDMHIFGD